MLSKAIQFAMIVLAVALTVSTVQGLVSKPVSAVHKAVPVKAAVGWNV